MTHWEINNLLYIDTIVCSKKIIPDNIFKKNFHLKIYNVVIVHVDSTLFFVPTHTILYFVEKVKSHKPPKILFIIAKFMWATHK